MADFSGFYKLPVEERLRRIKEHAQLSEAEVSVLKNTGALAPEAADRMSENVIGATHLPLSVALNFKINGKDAIIPMSVEEPSVVAAASNGAKLCLPEGFTASADEPVMVGQIQLVGLKDAKKAAAKVLAARKELEKAAREFTKSMEERGGGFRTLNAKPIKTQRGEMLIAYFEIDVRDSMGANTLNTMLEAIAPQVVESAGEGKVRLRILSNYADKRKARAKAVWKKEVIGEETVEGILDAYELARNDIYRAATHNKGIMNGIGAVAVATGNDWRAVEAGAHAYAARSGTYQPLTHYETDKTGNLVGTIELPLALGTVGGSISSNPVAKIALKIAGAGSAKELAMLAACAGLANNFAALRALSTSGIQKGHMKLHARNLAVQAGASTQEEIDYVSGILESEGSYKSSRAKEILEKLRSGK